MQAEQTGPVTRFGDGLAVHADLLVAAERASLAALAPLDGTVPDLVLVFVCPGDAGDADPDEVSAAGRRVAELTGARAVVGCSASGVLGGDRGVEAQRSVSVWAGVLPAAQLRTFHLEVMHSEAGAAVVGIPERTEQDEVVLLLADSWSFPVDGFLERANDALTGLPFVGGVAAGRTGGSTRLLVDGRAVDRGAVGVVIGGVGARMTISQGCRPVGPAMTVTGAVGNVVRSLAGSPALERVQQLLRELDPEDQALASAGLQLGVAMDEYADEHGTGDFLVRGILGTEPESNGLVVGDLLEVGRTVRLQVRDADTADAELRTLLAAQAPTAGALVFSCNGRGAALFGPSHGGADHDAGVAREVLGADGVAGFFAFGEIGPVGGRNHLHTFTAVVLCFP